MRSISLAICLFALVLSGCSSTFNGYRGTPQTPAGILRQGGDSLDDDYPVLEPKAATHVALKQLKTVSNPSSSIPPQAAPVHTAVTLQPTEYRRVWVAPHLNRFGDAIHGHHCEVLYKQAEFKPQLVPTLPPTAPVLVKKKTAQTPPGAVSTLSSTAVGSPMNLQHYLQQMGIAHHGK